MREDLMRIGDQVIVEISEYDRILNPNLPVVRTKAEIVAFGHFYCGRMSQSIPPGKYRSHSKVKVCFENGYQCVVSSECVCLSDRDEYVDRIAESSVLKEYSCSESTMDIFLEDLPDTLFWEGDLVFWRNVQCRIFRIHYEDLENRDGSEVKKPLSYNIFIKETKKIEKVAEGELSLVERGDVWKFYHKEPVSFDSLEEEIGFLRSIGRTREVKNPKNGKPDWSRKEIIEGMKSGLIHNFRVFCGLLDDEGRLFAERFLDEDFGRKVAQMRLERIAQAF